MEDLVVIVYCTTTTRQACHEILVCSLDLLPFILLSQSMNIFASAARHFCSANLLSFILTPHTLLDFSFQWRYPLVVVYFHLFINKINDQESGGKKRENRMVGPTGRVISSNSGNCNTRREKKCVPFFHIVIFDSVFLSMCVCNVNVDTIHGYVLV